ncbi:MAG: hypothetical protein KC468_29825 [Myxococcales bacterium]|nr:hypothetical protein [Myxococcales bacterium]
MAAHVDDPVLTPLHQLDGVREHASPRDRLRAVRRAAHELRERLLSGARVTYYETFDLAIVPYPLRYGLRDACPLPAPFVHILNRLFIVQFETADGALKTLLAEPLDRLGSAETPYFKRLAAPFGGSRALVPRLLWPPLGDVVGLLERVGIPRDEVDYITFDHLHTQDVRGWLIGKDGEPPVFPSAKLLVFREEWDDARAPIPPQRDWYPPRGYDGVGEDKLILLDRSVLLGDSVALVHTPGHTRGNHSIVAHTDDGLLVTSENGISADSYAPSRSRIPGLRRYAREREAEVVLNGNTLEGSTEQYLSMVLEKELAGPCPQNPDFYNVSPSSELAGHLLSPGLRPTFSFGQRRYGAPRTRSAVE